MIASRLARLAAIVLFAAAVASSACASEPIDRRALASRHNVVHRSAAPEHFLQVGNGEFAYAFDVTGMQTLDRAFAHPIPLHTMSNWGWHAFPNKQGFRYEQTLSEYPVGDRTASFADRQDSPAGKYFRANPHRVNLARIGLWWQGQDEAGAADLNDFTEVNQTFDLWTGCAISRFKFRGSPVTITTVAHPARDAVAFRIESPLVAAGELGVAIRYSYPRGEWGPTIDNFASPDSHKSAWKNDTGGIASCHRELDDFRYVSQFMAGVGAGFSPIGPHAWRVCWKGSEAGELLCSFNAGNQKPHLGWSDLFGAVRAAAADHWQKFWSHGGAIDLSGTADSRAAEIERRVVLSQYLTAIQNGSLPPQETGLLCNSWFGKQHIEMHWWHAAHFALWGRPEFLEQSLDWYTKILPQAQAIARRQGYVGARWPKMTGPNGVSSPSGVGEFLIWQQPHVIAMAELVYRTKTTDETLAKYAPLVDETAKFMANYVQWDADAMTCHLGPPLIPAQENYDRRTTLDPTFELAYWHWALSTAQKWRERLRQPRVPEWDRVIAGLPKPHVADGRYAAVATPPFTNTSDHPSMLAAFGVVPATPLVDPAVMLRTAHWVDDNWQWEKTWGWDFPMCAMTYARCGEPERAVNALLRATKKNTYLPNGHNYQEERLPVYLPGNGGVLAAAAMMAAGWDGGPEQSAPGFPADWKVRFEDLRPMP
jgi:hypothetical protein